MGRNNPIRIVDETGRIVLPADVSKEMRWEQETPVEIWYNIVEDEIIVKRHRDTCIHCGGEKNLKEFRKKNICSSCCNKISKI